MSPIWLINHLTIYSHAGWPLQFGIRVIGVESCIPLSTRDDFFRSNPAHNSPEDKFRKYHSLWLVQGVGQPTYSLGSIFAQNVSHRLLRPNPFVLDASRERYCSGFFLPVSCFARWTSHPVLDTSIVPFPIPRSSSPRPTSSRSSDRLVICFPA
jgi:hypothetical protein